MVCMLSLLQLMAGWHHYSRNHAIFVSAMLLISLAMFVHLLPYAYSVCGFSFMLHSAWSPQKLHSSQLDAKHCLQLLHEIEWESTNDSRLVPQVLSLENVHQYEIEKEWLWKEDVASRCQFQKMNKAAALNFLAGAHILVIGDSQVRFFVVALLKVLLPEVQTVKAKLFKHHSNYEHRIPEHGIRIEFVWAPYVDNVTTLLSQLKDSRTFPDLVIMGTGLWHMFHITNASDYGHSLQKLMDVHFLSSGGLTAAKSQQPHLFWLTIPTLVPSRLNSSEKKEKLTNDLVAAYNWEAGKVGLIHPTGPLMLLNLHKLTGKCGPCCSLDGMHYDDYIYDSLVHVMLNTLTISSRKKDG